MIQSKKKNKNLVYLVITSMLSYECYENVAKPRGTVLFFWVIWDYGSPPPQGFSLVSVEIPGSRKGNYHFCQKSCLALKYWILKIYFSLDHNIYCSQLFVF